MFDDELDNKENSEGEIGDIPLIFEVGESCINKRGML